VSAGSRRTTLVIAHRLTTVRGADKIIVLGSKDAAGGMAGGGSMDGSVVLEEGTQPIHLHLVDQYTFDSTTEHPLKSTAT
jgi:excinuclease UvrABC ATPase subunit